VSTPRTLALAALISLVPLAAACGGGEEASESSTTSAPSESPAASTPTEDSASGGGSSAIDPASAEFCAVSDRLDAVFAGELESGTDFTEEQIAIFEEVKAAAPDEISGAVTTVLDAYQERGYDESLFTDPEFTGAAQEVAVFVGANCGDSTDDAGTGDDPDTPVSNEPG
jgi:hypothetical protein